MRYCVIVSCPPEQKASKYAFRFCQTIVNSGHELIRVFFRNDGVLHALGLPEINYRWSEFSNVELLCCASSASRYLSHPNENKNPPLNNDFEIAGLAQLVEAEISCDSIVTFGQR